MRSLFLCVFAAVVLAACSEPLPTDASAETSPTPSADAADASHLRTTDIGLVSFWPLNGNGHDWTQRNVLTVSGATPIANRWGWPNHAIWFNGTGDFLTREAPQGIDFDLLLDDYTFSFWVRSPEGSVSRLLQKWNEFGSSPYAYSFQTTVTGLNAVVYDGSTVTLVHAPDLWDDAWHHVAVTYEAATRTLRIYRDGVQTGTAQASVSRSTRNTAPLMMGRAPKPVETRYYLGALDDVAVFSRALPAAQVAALAR